LRKLRIARRTARVVGSTQVWLREHEVEEGESFHLPRRRPEGAEISHPASKMV
jgi:hypothetical protein